jgi:hypothetical protein
MNNDRDGHARTWDVFEAHTQDETRDPVGRIGLERKSWGKAAAGRVGGRHGVGAPVVEDGVLSG